MKAQLSQQSREDTEDKQEAYHFMPEIYDELVDLNQFVKKSSTKQYVINEELI